MIELSVNNIRCNRLVVIRACCFGHAAFEPGTWSLPRIILGNRLREIRSVSWQARCESEDTRSACVAFYKYRLFVCKVFVLAKAHDIPPVDVTESMSLVFTRITRHVGSLRCAGLYRPMNLHFKLFRGSK
jgi:hypothetical protein